MVNMNEIEVSTFRYRTCIGLDIEEIFRTTYFDGMDFWREGDLTLDDAERHVVSIIENDKEFRTIIANQLHELANAIETGEEKLRGYICDYDSYPVYDLNGVIKIDWFKLNEEKKLKNNDKNTEK